MATPVLLYQPVRDSYTLTPAYNSVEVRLSGGKSRKRLDFLGGVHTVTPTWILDKGNYTKFMGFFRERVQQGSRQFRASLLTDISFVTLHVCTLVGGMPKLVQQAGDAYFVTATLEVTPNPTKSFSLFLSNAGTPLITDAGTVDYLGDTTEFPVGRDIILTGTRDTVVPSWAGVYIDLDAQYTIQANSGTQITPLNAAIVNPAWTTLNGLSPQSYFPSFGAMILVPL